MRNVLFLSLLMACVLCLTAIAAADDADPRQPWFIAGSAAEYGTGALYLVQNPEYSITSSGDVVVEASLVNGDCDDDNEITTSDLSIVIANLRKVEGEPGYDHLADLDGDREITTSDLSIVIANLRMIGDPWPAE
jgi:hypothetical protein